MLAGKTVGIVGVGQIGSHAARRFRAFGCRVAGYQRRPRPEPTIFADLEWLSLDELLRVSDVVVLCLPLSDETNRLIGARELGLMKPTAVLVNCGRGEVVDEGALFEALAERRIRAAGLDVFSQELTPPDHPLLRLENVFATPHIAGRAREIQPRQIQSSLEIIEVFLKGRRPANLVNSEILESGQARATHLLIRAGSS